MDRKTRMEQTEYISNIIDTIEDLFFFFIKKLNNETIIKVISSINHFFMSLLYDMITIKKVNK